MTLCMRKHQLAELATPTCIAQHENIAILKPQS